MEGSSWNRRWSPQQLDGTKALGNWADVILGFGSRSAWDRMAGWPEMARWRQEGKMFLWLHTAPVDESMEEMQSSDFEVIRREVWSQIDPLFAWLSNFAERSLDRRRSEPSEEELSRLTRIWEQPYKTSDIQRTLF